MALLYIEGFEGYSSATDLVTVGSANSSRCVVANGGSILNTYYRTAQVTAANSRSLAINGDTFGLKIAGCTEAIVGFGIYLNSTSSATHCIWTVGGTSPWSTSQGIAVGYVATTGTLSVHINSSGAAGTLLGTATGTFAANIWHYIELRVKLGSTTGEVQMKVNGVEVLNLTNVNTATGSLTSYTGMGCDYALGYMKYLDDIYICDTTGSINNTFLGPISVYTLMPTGAGSATEMDPIGAASNWEAVDEGAADTTTYVETTVTGEKDYYTYEALPAGVSTVFGVVARTRNTTPDNGGRRLRMNMKNGINTISSGLRNLVFGSWVYEIFLSETAPDGSAWTKTSVDNTEVGVEAQ